MVRLYMGKRSWTPEEKLKILSEAKDKGVKATLEKYGVYPATYYAWKKKFLVYGKEGLADVAGRKAARQRVAELEEKLSLLQQLLAEKEAELRLKDELLRKKYPKQKRKR